MNIHTHSWKPLFDTENTDKGGKETEFPRG